eukprot:363865-Chlamydomonas_euryale.AAC.15
MHTRTAYHPVAPHRERAPDRTFVFLICEAIPGAENTSLSACLYADEAGASTILLCERLAITVDAAAVGSALWLHATIVRTMGYKQGFTNPSSSLSSPRPLPVSPYSLSAFGCHAAPPQTPSTPASVQGTPPTHVNCQGSY